MSGINRILNRVCCVRVSPRYHYAFLGSLLLQWQTPEAMAAYFKLTLPPFLRRAPPSLYHRALPTAWHLSCSAIPTAAELFPALSLPHLLFRPNRHLPNSTADSRSRFPLIRGTMLTLTCSKHILPQKCSIGTHSVPHWISSSRMVLNSSPAYYHMFIFRYLAWCKMRLHVM